MTIERLSVYKQNNIRQTPQQPTPSTCDRVMSVASDIFDVVAPRVALARTLGINVSRTVIREGAQYIKQFAEPLVVYPLVSGYNYAQNIDIQSVGSRLSAAGKPLYNAVSAVGNYSYDYVIDPALVKMMVAYSKIGIYKPENLMGMAIKDRWLTLGRALLKQFPDMPIDRSNLDHTDKFYLHVMASMNLQEAAERKNN